MIDAIGYGKALFELAQEQEIGQQVSQELELVCSALEENPGYVTLLDSPAVDTAERLSLLKASFGETAEILRNFLCILCEKRSFYQLPACAGEYRRAYDEACNLLRATAITAVPMTPAQQERLKAKLAELTGKTVILENRTDETLIGGITLRYGGVQLDDSIRNRLDKLRRSLSDTIV